MRRTVLAARVTQLFDASGRTYVSPRITLDLRAEGWQVSVNTVARLMAELGLAGRLKRRRHSLTRQVKRPVARDLVRRHFDAVAPDVLWCGDMTEIVTGEGKVYLATVIDMFSRRMLGYAIGERHDAGLVVDALRMAVATRGGADGVIFHSDSETVEAGVPRVLDSHSDGHDRMLVPGAPRVPDPHSDRRSVVFPRICRSLGTSGEALRLAVGVT